MIPLPKQIKSTLAVYFQLALNILTHLILIINIMIKASILTLALLAITTHAISIPVNSQTDKCMMVYSSNSEDYLKIDLKFDKFNGQTETEYYRVLLIDTETNSEQAFNVTDGLFRREIQLTENVLYRLCIKIMLNRYGSREVQQFIEYNTAVRHRHDADTKIQIPANLLKIKDLQQSYNRLLALQSFITQVKERKASIDKAEDQIFNQQQEKIGKIEWITIIELLFVGAFGVYQYYRLRNIIFSKQSS